MLEKVSGGFIELNKIQKLDYSVENNGDTKVSMLDSHGETLLVIGGDKTTISRLTNYGVMASGYVLNDGTIEVVYPPKTLLKSELSEDELKKMFNLIRTSQDHVSKSDVIFDKAQEKHMHEQDKIKNLPNDQTSSKNQVYKATFHAVFHSHLDLGWIVTELETYSRIVRPMISSMIEYHQKQPKMKFVFADHGFLYILEKKDPHLFKQFIKLVQSNNVEIVGGGFSMNDYASPTFD